MGASSEETRRHFDVVSESLRGEIRTVAEGVVANSERIERVGAEIRQDMNTNAKLLHTAIRGVHTALASQRRRRRRVRPRVPQRHDLSREPDVPEVVEVGIADFHPTQLLRVRLDVR